MPCYGRAIAVATLIVSLVIVARIGSAGQRGDASVIRRGAARLNGPISDEFWRTAEPVNDFVQREPNEGGAPSQRTEFRVAYDASTIYIKVRAFDTEPDKIVGYLTRRDSDSPSDWIHVLIDSYHDRRTAYDFGVNPAGVKQDRYWYNDSNRDDSWDAVWDVAVSRDADGWTADFAIPVSQLRFTPGESTTFGFAVSREIARLKETSTWPLLARSAVGYVSSFGEIGDLAMTASPKRLELAPYTVAKATTEPTGGNPLLKSPAGGGALGLDLKYALTPGLTLTATLNPDFGQVEADPAVVNLTAFETFFNERRPFFVEGSGAFSFNSDCASGPCSMFYSRRVGRPPQGTGSLPSGPGIFTETAANTTILGAGKLTGRIGRFSIGVMNAVTQQEVGTVLDGDRKYERPVEPLTNYTVARVRREFTSQSSFGLIATAAKRRVPAPLQSIPSGGYAGGLDWDLRFRRRFNVSGYWVGTSVRGSPESIEAVQQTSRHYYQRPDASSFHLDPARRSLNGSSGRVSVSKIAGARIRFSSDVGYKSPGFDVNDVGFLRRADERWTSNWFQIRSERPSRWFRSRFINFNYWRSWNADGDVVSNGGNVNGNVEFINNWSTGGGIGKDFSFFDDRLTRGGPGGLVNGYDLLWSFLNSDSRKPIWINVFNGVGRDGQGTWHRDHELNVNFRPQPALTVTPGVRINRASRDSQWVENVTGEGGHYIFANLNQTTVAFTGRMNYTLSPNLSMEFYAEPFVSGAAFDRFKELVDGRNDRYVNRFTPYAVSTENPDFNVRSFRTTNVLRWEYKPGSTLFVVWQQARADAASVGDFRFGRDFRAVFQAPAQNVFLIKLAYWLNY